MTTPVKRYLSIVRLTCFSLVLLFSTSCDTQDGIGAGHIKDNPVLSAAPPDDSVRTTVWECGDVMVTVQTLAETAWVYFGDSVYELRQAPAGSGVRFVGEGAVFRNKGVEAIFDLKGGFFENCRLIKREGSWEAARLRGMDFRALGQEPGWILEIFKGDSIVFLADYATRKIVTPYKDPQTEAPERKIVYTTNNDTHSLQITIVEDSCTDIMSGFKFPAAVKVRLNGKLYEGCGRDL